MSEAGEVTAGAGEVKATPEAAKIDYAEFEKRAMDAAVAKLSEIVPTIERKLASDFKASEAQRNQQLAKALGVVSDEDPEAGLVARLKERPSEVLAHVGALVKEGLLREMSEKEAADTEAKAAVAEVFKERHDVISDEKAKRLVSDFYLATDSSFSVKERMQGALKKYDTLMEDLGKGSTKDRLASVRGLSGGGKGGFSGSSKDEPGTYQDRLEAANKNYMAEVQKRQQLIRGDR